MAVFNRHHFPLLLLLHLMTCFFSVQEKPFLSATQTLTLPLKAQTYPHGPPDKLSFQHNVTLTVSISAGWPPQKVTMVLDTGSELSWLNCNKTLNFTSVFNPNSSSSYSTIPCSSSFCINWAHVSIPVPCDQRKFCHVAVSYSDGSSMEGSLASDHFSIRSSAGPSLFFGCMTSIMSSNPEEDSKTTGLMGLNLGPLSFVSQMHLPKFSYCIPGSNSSGVLLLGEMNITWLQSLNYTGLVNISGGLTLPSFDYFAYTVQLEGIKVGTKKLSIRKSEFERDHTGAGQTIIDSGTQFTLLLSPVYTVLKDEFTNQTRRLLEVDPNFVFQGTMDLCFRVRGNRVNYSSLPAVTLMFPGAEIRVSGKNLLYRVPGETTRDCFTFGNSGLLYSEKFVIGQQHQQDVWMEFDIAKSRVGMAKTRCDLASQKLGLGP